MASILSLYPKRKAEDERDEQAYAQVDLVAL
jgi:hypothetical protein